MSWFSRHSTSRQYALHECGKRRSPISINLHATTNIRHVEILLWVTESVRIDDLYRRGVLSASGPKRSRRY
jgi:hypothetical protein